MSPSLPPGAGREPDYLDSAPVCTKSVHSARQAFQSCPPGAVKTRSGGSTWAAMPFARANGMAAQVLPPERVFTAPGGHDWKAWRALWTDFVQTGALSK